MKEPRTRHHDFLRRTFAGALDEDDLADPARIMDRISASMPARVAERA
ncbi:MAG TPA: hypothetical protein VED20_03300 [Streptosporangiaceae bacterium]|nr:hypothetical protein [Streptosporangiaceae bacterium]